MKPNRKERRMNAAHARNNRPTVMKGPPGYPDIDAEFGPLGLDGSLETCGFCGHRFQHMEAHVIGWTKEKKPGRACLRCFPSAIAVQKVLVFSILGQTQRPTH